MTDLPINTVPETSSETGNAYRYKRLNLGLFLADLKFSKTAPKAGNTFPPFELVTTDGRCLTNRDVFNDKPVLFVIGSMTCPMTASSMPDVKKLYDELGGRVDFIMLQAREAHPGEDVPQPETMEEKVKHAQTLKDFYDIQWTVAADNIDGDLHRALDPKPNSVFLADSDGTILFRSIWAGDTDAIRQSLETVAAGQPLKRKQSVAMMGPMARAMGQVDATMKRGGRQAGRDLWRVGFPVALAGRIATFFSPLTPNQRGVVAVLTLASIMVAALGFLGAGILA